MTFDEKRLGGAVQGEDLPAAGAAEPSNAPRPRGKMILECGNLTKRYGSKTALDGVSFQVEEGGVVGLLGPNGSGKSTLIKLAMGMIQPTAGAVLVDGKPPCAATKAVTSYLPDCEFLPRWMKVEQAIAYFADFFPDFRRERAEATLSRLGVEKKDRIRSLSKGNREKLGLALTMARDAKLYILDEPIAGVDPAARDFILDTVMRNKPQSSTVFLCTHLIADIEPILTHAIFLDRGHVVLNEDAETVRVRENKSLDALFREVFRW